jgi:drug/metabolite transporter (DMT)-like permease
LNIPKQYKGILFMLMAAMGFSTMGGAAKLLKNSFDVGLLSFYRNFIGLVVILFSFYIKPPVQQGGKFKWLAFRGLMGTTALYTLFFCILHLPLGTAMTYNLTSTLFIALFSFVLFGEYHGKKVLFAVLLGFAGMILIYKPNMHFPLAYHGVGLLSGITSAIAYLTVGRLTRIYDHRVIVLSFLMSGVLVPVISMLLHYVFHLPADGLFVISWQWPQGIDWIYVLTLGLAALFGQYFVTRAYASDKAGIVSAISYANIVFSVFIGMALGDRFPDIMSLGGIVCIILSGVIISLTKRKAVSSESSD